MSDEFPFGLKPLRFEDGHPILDANLLVIELMKEFASYKPELVNEEGLEEWYIFCLEDFNYNYDCAFFEGCPFYTDLDPEKVLTEIRRFFRL